MKNFALIGVGGYIAPRHMQAIKDTQALQATRIAALKQANDARAALSVLEDSEAKQLLLYLCDSSVKRDH